MNRHILSTRSCSWVVALLAMVIACGIPTEAKAQKKKASVHGTYTYVVSENDNITLFEAKERSIAQAKNAAMIEEFGQLIVNDVFEASSEGSGGSSNTYIDNSRVTAKGIWIADKKDPEINVRYKDGKLYFTAEVWGEARQLTQAQVNFSWNIQKELDGKTVNTKEFNSGDRIFINFRTPAKGYVAVYLILGNGKTYCLLPYSLDADGIFPVSAGRDYLFFDKKSDVFAKYYKLTTDNAMEFNRLVVIYSPNRFTKCIDVSTDSSKPNSLSDREFYKWLSNCQSLDEDMVVDSKWVKIYNHAKDQNQ